MAVLWENRWRLRIYPTRCHGDQANFPDAWKDVFVAKVMNVEPGQSISTQAALSNQL